MPKASRKNRRYTAADMRAVSDNPEWTKDDFAKAKRFDEAFPDLARTIRRRGKQKTPTKKAVSVRLDARRAGGVQGDWREMAIIGSTMICGRR